MTRSRIAIFASGNGSNAEEIIRYFSKHPSVEIALLLSNNPQAYALTRAANHSIPTRTFDRATYRDTTQVLEWLTDAGITHVVLAGFLWLIPSYLLDAYPARIINIHPALLPRHGGKGMYGMKVHEAVKRAGDRETGITIHLVDAQYDRGKVVFQAKCKVDPHDDPAAIAQKVHNLEYGFFPAVIENWILEGRDLTSTAG